ncbi:MAG: hypothetical protein ACI8QZ_002205 [Chlamydiales bacterium]|jgi:hypothetical protein
MISTYLRILGLVMVGMPALAGDSLFKDLTVYDALAAARRSNQVVLVSWTRPDDPACKRMEATWEDSEMIDWVNKNAIAVQIDGSKERRQAQNWEIRAYPSVLLIKPDGTVVVRVNGVQPLNELLVEFSVAARAARSGKRAVVEQPRDDAANDPEAWLAYANGLYASGETDAVDCMHAYLWCLDNGDIQTPGFMDRYLELILRRLVSLDKTTTSSAELRQRSHEYARALNTGYGTPSSLRVLMSIGAALGEPSEAIGAFQSIRTSSEPDPEMLEVALHGVLETLMGRRRYEDVLDAAGDVSAKARLDGATMNAGVAGADPKANTPVASEARRLYIERNGSYYEALLSVGRGADAKALADTVLEMVPTGNAYAVFISRAKRAGVTKVAEQLCATGMEKVSTERGKKMMQRALAAQPMKIRRVGADAVQEQKPGTAREKPTVKGRKAQSKDE